MNALFFSQKRFNKLTEKEKETIRAAIKLCDLTLFQKSITNDGKETFKVLENYAYRKKVDDRDVIVLDDVSRDSAVQIFKEYSRTA